METESKRDMNALVSDGTPRFPSILETPGVLGWELLLNKSQNEKSWKRERERERERERMPGSGIGPCVRPVSDLFQTPAKVPSQIRKTLPRIPSTSIVVQRLMKHQLGHGAKLMPAIAEQSFRNSMLDKRMELRS